MCPTTPATQEDSILKVFAFDIHLPDESSPRFYVFHDLAELFGEEFNRDAIKRLKKLLAGHSDNPKGKLTSDYEADKVSLSSSQPQVMWLVARLINENPVQKYKKDCNGELAYGQVLSKDYRAPSCALFEAKSHTVLSVNEIRKTRGISILHLGSDLLDKGRWKVIGAARPVANPDSSSLGKRFAVGTRSFGGGMALQDLAEAYFGLAPWNAGHYGDDYRYDKQLMPGVKRPSQCLWLSEEERKAYRAKHGITA